MAEQTIAGVPVKELFGPYFSKQASKYGRYTSHAASDSSSDSDSDQKSMTFRRASTAKAVVTHTSSSSSKAVRRISSSKSTVEEELRDNLHFLELQLVNLRDENAKLKQSYHMKLEELSSTLKIVEEKSTAERASASAYRDLEARLNKVEDEKAAILSRSMMNLRTYEEETLEKDRDMRTMSTRMSNLEETLRMVRQERVLLLEKSQALEAHKTQLESDVKLLQSQLATTQAELRTADVTASSVPELTAQSHHLRADNARLVKLLASTTEYKSFMAYSFPKDSSPRSDGRMRSVYVPPSGPAVEPPKSAAGHSSSSRLVDGPSRRSDASLVLADLTYEADTGSPQLQERAASDTAASWHDVQAYLQHYATADTTRVDHSSEGDHWVPEEAMDLASSFKRKHLSHVPPSLIREFLLELNHVWRRRFNKQCANVKERYTAQIKELKRLLSQRVSYREVVQQAEIARLTRELDNARHATTLTGRARSASRSRQAPNDLQVVVTDSGHARFGWCSRMNVHVKDSSASDSMLLEKSLSAVDSLSKKVATFAERNSELERSFKALSTSTVSKRAVGSANMQAFSAAVRWFGSDVMTAVDHMGNRVSQLVEELQRGCANLSAASDTSMADIRRQISAIAAIQKEVVDLRIHLRHLFENALSTAIDADKYDGVMALVKAST